MVGCWACGEGTGTRPDYLVNHEEKKLRARSGKKIAQKSRNSCIVNGQGCGCIGTLDSRPTFAQSYNQIQTLVLAVTSIAHIFAHICARLLQSFAQSLIGSPGTHHLRHVCHGKKITVRLGLTVFVLYIRRSYTRVTRRTSVSKFLDSLNSLGDFKTLLN